MLENRIEVLISGDIMLGGEFASFRERNGLGYEYPFKNLKAFFEEADIVFGNLECCLFKTGALREDKSRLLHASPDSIQALKYLNYNIICIGNNHINDYGDEGLIRTIDIIRQNQILSFGAGRNTDEAGQAAFIKNGTKFAFLGYTGSETNVRAIMAGPHSAGCVPYELCRIRQDIERIRSGSDIICISLHWGYEYYLYPSPEQIELAHRIIDAGADIVIGHHPHVIQGIEIYKEKPIIYSLGNFLFPDFRDREGNIIRWPQQCKKSIIVRCRIAGNKITDIEVIPCIMDNYFQLSLLEGNDKDRMLSIIDRLSCELKREDYGRFWQDYKDKMEKQLDEERISRSLGNIRRQVAEGQLRGLVYPLSIKRLLQLLRLLMRYFWLRMHRVGKKQLPFDKLMRDL